MQRIRLLGTFSNIHPLVFLLIYLLSVPAFGGAYALLPAPSFYAPFTRFEPSAKSDANRVAADIYATIKLSLAHAAPADQAWRIDPDSISVSDVTVTPERELTFAVHFVAGNQDRMQLGWVLNAVVPARSRVATIGNTGAIISHIVELHPSHLPPLPNMSEANLVKQLFRSSAPEIIAPVISLSREQEQHLVDFERGRQGDPSAVSGDFGRMTYFSAMTITTVGFGDIIPMTPIARLLAAIEAVLGWTLAGFFLNAAAHRIGSSSVAHDSNTTKLSGP